MRASDLYDSLSTKTCTADAATSPIPVVVGIQCNGMEVNWVISVVNKQALIEPFFRVASGCARETVSVKKTGSLRDVDFSDAIFPLLQRCRRSSV